MSLREGEQAPRARRRKQPKTAAETRAERNQRLALARAEQLRLRQRLLEDDDAVWTFKEWCAVNGISPRQGRRILKSGSGPLVTMLSDKRIGISRRHDRLWKASRVR
jgi:hypothetical protein